MAKNKLFKELDLSHKPKRNGYDLSRTVRFSAKAGELLPAMHMAVIPYDNVKINLKSFTRTDNMKSDARVQIREYFDFYFVPYRLLYRNSRSVITQNQDNPEFATSQYTNTIVPTKMPWFSFSTFYGIFGSGQSIMQKLSTLDNEFGLNRGAMSMKLMNCLGYGYMTALEHRSLYFENPVVSNYPFTNMPDAVSAIPLLAYQKIYYDMYRNTQWEDNQPYNYNVDYLTTSSTLLSFDTSTNPNGFWDNPTIFDLRYSNYPKDLFFGVMPESQSGDIAEVEVDNENLPLVQNLYLETSSGQEVRVGDPQTVGNYGIAGKQENVLNTGDSLMVRLERSLNQLKSTFNILEFRQAQFTQKYKEIIGSGKQDYQARIKKIFGVDVDDTLSDHVIYLGGNSSDIHNQSITNTNVPEGSPATIQANGVGKGSGDTITFKAQEHGIIMCIYHCQPVIDYSLNAPHFDILRVDADDWANPVFDQLGFQELPFYYLNVGKLGNGEYNNLVPHVGYTTRYFDWKTSVDVTLGDWRETRNMWLAPVNLDYLNQFVIGNGTSTNPYKFDLNANFFKVNPSILDPIFYIKANTPYVDTDQFMVEARFEVNAVRPLDYLGVPY